jgi:hypothetical protein
LIQTQGKQLQPLELAARKLNPPPLQLHDRNYRLRPVAHIDVAKSLDSSSEKMHIMEAESNTHVNRPDYFMANDLAAVLAARDILRNLLENSDLDTDLAIAVMKVLQLLDRDLQKAKAADE